jgi:tetratricopeptide (TPR) repeat protein
MTTRKFFKLLCTGFVLGGVLIANIASSASQNPYQIPGYPDRIDDYDAREVAMLPPYCKHTQLFRDRIPGGNNPAEISRWSSTLGPTFPHLHHYCWGLMKTNRAVLLARTRQAKNSNLDTAIKEFDYVLQRAPEDFVLLPEILTKRGENLIRLGRGANAVRDLERAIEIKADYWPPYVALSDYYKASGDATKARALLEKALSFAPEIKTIKNRLAELDGVKGKQKPSPRTPSDDK